MIATRQPCILASFELENHSPGLKPKCPLPRPRALAPPHNAETAEHNLDGKIKQAVMSVPAEFTEVLLTATLMMMVDRASSGSVFFWGGLDSLMPAHKFLLVGHI